MPRSVTRREFLIRSVALAAAVPLAHTVAAAAAPAERWKIGIFTRPWDQFDYRTALDAIAAAGYRGVGLMTTKSPRGLVITHDMPADEVQKIAADIRDRKLATLSIYGGEGWLKSDVPAGVEGLKRLIDNCAVCGSSNLLLGGTGDKDLLDAYVKTVAGCAAYAAGKGVAMSIKPHGGLNATGPQLRELVGRVNHPNFRVWFDPGNIYYYSDGQLDPVEQAGTLDGLVSGMCVKDFLPPKNVAVTPGTGKVDFPGVIRRLAKGGLKGGSLVIECLAPGEPAPLLVEARKAREFVEKLVAE